MGFHEVQFPTGISYGSRGGPGFATNIIEIDSGAEERVARWSAPRRRYDVSYGVRSKADLSALITFYIARQGAAYGFRYKDWLDFTSASDHRSAPTNTDVTLGTGGASETDFQLIKKYVSGGVTRTRNIAKPVTGSVVVALDGVNQSSGWTVDTTTGVVTFTTPPGSGVVVSAGFEFDVPVRFGKEADALLGLQLDAFDIGGVSSIPLIEVRDELEASEDFFYGGGQYMSLSADRSVAISDGRALALDPQSSGLVVNLPALASLVAGGPYFYLKNESGSYSLTVKDSGGSTVTTLAAGATAVLLVTDTGGGSLDWLAI
ncbi:MAG: DUF2460 domain-containing protein [Planctomycetota bacterium]